LIVKEKGNSSLPTPLGEQGITEQFLSSVILYPHEKETKMNAELARERKEREDRQKMITLCDKLVCELEVEVQQLLVEIEVSEQAGKIGRDRHKFQNKAKVLNEKGTLHILKVDSIQASNKRERDVARAARKKLIARIETCSKNCASLL